MVAWWHGGMESRDNPYTKLQAVRKENIHGMKYVGATWDSTKEVNRTLKKARKEEKEERHQQREDRRREMEFVPKARFEGWDQERVDDL